MIRNCAKIIKPSDNVIESIYASFSLAFWSLVAACVWSWNSVVLVLLAKSFTRWWSIFLRCILKFWLSLLFFCLKFIFNMFVFLKLELTKIENFMISLFIISAHWFGYWYSFFIIIALHQKIWTGFGIFSARNCVMANPFIFISYF